MSGTRTDDRRTPLTLDIVSRIYSKTVPWPLLALALVSLMAAMALIGFMQAHDKTLSTGPQGANILTLEFALRASKANCIVRDWLGDAADQQCPAAPKPGITKQRSAPGTDAAKAAIKIDFAFIFVYVVLLLSALWYVLRNSGLPLDGFWTVITLLPVAAGLFDVGENILLLGVIAAAGNAQPAIVYAVSALAISKFALLGLFLAVTLSLIGYCLFSAQTKHENAGGSAIRSVNLKEVRNREAAYLRSRRQMVGIHEPGQSGNPNWIGLSLSGGGIRSATVCLGVIQSLMRSGFLPRVDYLSTVSGGGYIGTALSSLLSFRPLDRYPGATDREQYEFRTGEKAHFDLRDTECHGFDPKPETPEATHHRWLSGKMVVEHLRAFGEYLVRRRRVLSRDVLRAIGAIASGLAATVLLFALFALLLASTLATVIEAAGGSVISESYATMTLPTYLAMLWYEISGMDHASGILAFGALSSVALVLSAGTVAKRLPSDWFKRTGDTPAESQQHRALWIVGSIAAGLGFLVLPHLGNTAIGPGNRLLFIPTFFLGAALITFIAYIALAVLAKDETALRSNTATRSYVTANNGLFLYLFALSASITLIPWVLSQLHEAGSNADMLGGVGTVAAVVSGLAAWLRQKRASSESRAKHLVSRLKQLEDFLLKFLLGVAVLVFVVVAIILALATVVSLLVLFGANPPDALHYLFFASATTVLWSTFGYAMDFNKLSLHYFYRDRLSEAYLRTLGPEANRTDAQSIDTQRRMTIKRDNGLMLLSELHGILQPRSAEATQDVAPPIGEKPAFVQQAVTSEWRDRVKITGAPKTERMPFEGAATAAPYHLYNTCLNLTTDRDMKLRSRKSAGFIFSKLFCGSDVTGYVDTTAYRSGETKVTRAMTISGAAADTALGNQTFFAQSFATTLFNIRLGQWLENPCYKHGRHVHRHENWVFWPKYMLMEMLGISDARRRLIHLSDGGHTGDNLGIIPLLKRRCALIIAVDAECDPEYGFGSLMNALRYAEVDLGIKFNLDLSPIRPDENGLSDAHFAVGQIHYPATDDDDDSDGTLIVLKSSVTDDDDETIRMFRKTHENFPQEPTIDQFFSEDQFEAYLAVGSAIGGDLIYRLQALTLTPFDMETVHRAAKMLRLKSGTEEANSA